MTWQLEQIALPWKSGLPLAASPLSLSSLPIGGSVPLLSVRSFLSAEIAFAPASLSPMNSSDLAFTAGLLIAWIIPVSYVDSTVSADYNVCWAKPESFFSEWLGRLDIFY